MVCNNCGTPNAEGAMACVNCGAPLTAAVAENTDNGKGFAIASLVLGIVSIFCFAIITGTLAIVFSRMAKSKGYPGGMATAGLVCGIIGLIGWVISMVMYAFF